MKVLIVVDKVNSAIYNCALAMNHVKDFFTQFDIVAVHPKKPSVDELERFKLLAREADIIDFQYWKTAEMLLRSFPFLSGKKKILTHHNPYNLLEMDWWTRYNAVYVKNKTQRKIIKEHFGREVGIIPHTIDTGFFEFQRDYPRDGVFKVIMVAARIEDKKGILEVAKACRVTKTRLILVGRISDMNYFRQIAMEAGNYIDFRQDISNEDLRKSYYEAHLFVNNSSDGFESGSLPHLEAMSCGVPVLTRNVGLVPDIYNGKNMIVREGEKGNVDEIIKYIEELRGNRGQRESLRENAFKSIVDRDNKYTAIRYYREYRKVLYGDFPLVSVIIPTYNRAEVLLATLTSLVAQNYSNIEVIVVDDGSDDGTEQAVMDFKEISSLSLKYIKQEKRGYGLARARNRGVVVSNGDILVFLDDRLAIEENAIELFVEKLKPRVWVFGDKGADKKTFVENFSAIFKKDLVGMGMFNERINQYGGMTRDLLNRMGYNGIKYLYINKAKAKPLIGSKSRYVKKGQILHSRYLLWKLYGGR